MKNRNISHRFIEAAIAGSLRAVSMSRIPFAGMSSASQGNWPF